MCEARMPGVWGHAPQEILNFILSAEVASGGLCDPNLQPYCIQHVATNFWSIIIYLIITHWSILVLVNQQWANKESN